MINSSIMPTMIRKTPPFSQPGIRGVFVFHSAFQWILIAAMIGLSTHACPNVYGQVNSGQVKSDEQPVQAVVETRAKGDCIVVTNLKNASAATVRVWRSDANIESSPPIMGTASIEKGNLVFTPRFPFQPGTRYVVDLHPDPNSTPRQFRVEVPGKPEPKTTVVGFYPSADQLPENALKFYVQFSAPMQKGDIYRFVRLREEGGKNVELPFLEIEQEFWSRDSKRLTLLLDPGRIKRGLQPRELMGPILEAGKSYELVVDKSWPDANGNQLGKDYMKRFEAVAEDHTQPDPAKWKITAPVAGSRKPLVISFPESLDHAMLFGSINVVDRNSERVDGTVTVSNDETRWSLLPMEDWQAGTYAITVSEDLEDNVGNSVGRPFDVDLFDQTESSDSTPLVELEFEVGK